MFTVASMIRDADEYIEQYIGQIEALSDYRPLRVVLHENDSKDNTIPRLQKWAFEHKEDRQCQVVLLHSKTGMPYFASEDRVVRWQHLSWLCNTAIHHPAYVQGDDHFMYVEADLAWDLNTVLELIEKVETSVGAASPMNVFEDGTQYDTWGTYLTSGVTPGCLSDREKWSEAASVAGMTVVNGGARGDLLEHKIRFGHNDCYKGFCRSLLDNGIKLYLAEHLRVVHPR